MKLQPAGIDPRIRRLPANYKRAVALELGPLTLEMSAAEALDLANRIVDAAEQHETTPTG